MPVARSERRQVSGQQILSNRVNYFGPIEQTTNLLIAAVIRDVWVDENLPQRSATMVFADHVLCRELLALWTREEKPEGSEIHVILLRS
jgi:hypothetical protein